LTIGFTAGNGWYLCIYLYGLCYLEIENILIMVNHLNPLAPSVAVDSPVTMGAIAPTTQQAKENAHSLILACGRTVLDDDSRQQIQALIDAGVDWEVFYQQAHRHEVIPLMFLSLKRAAHDRIPFNLVRLFALYTHTSAIQRRQTVDHLGVVLDGMRLAKIPAIPYKGPTLAMLVYGNLNLRHFKDLDIVVPPRDYQRAQSVLLAQGYVLVGELGYESEFHHPTLGIAIDLHRTLFAPHFAYGETFLTLSSRLRAIDCGDQRLYSMNPEDLLIFLALQVGKDSCCGRLRLGQFCDVAELVRRHPDLSWERLMRRARRLGALRMLGLVLYLVHDWFQVAVPPAVLAHWRGDYQDWIPLIDRINTKLWQENGQPPAMDESGFFEFMTSYDHQFYWQMRESLWAKLKYGTWWSRAIVHAALAPSGGDRELVQLPRLLGFLYFPIHWWRMLLKYGPWRSALNRR
jgi:hypothetical protein